MGRYSRKDMIEFAKFAKSYQSSRNVEEAYAAYLKGARLLTKRDFTLKKLFMLYASDIAYLDGKIVKNRFGDTETRFPRSEGFNYKIESWDAKTKILKLKSI